MSLTLQYRCIPLVARVMIFLAAISLASLGGSYSHAAKAEHAHFSDFSSDHQSDDHEHVDLPGAKAKFPANVHCGGEIFAAQELRIAGRLTTSISMSPRISSVGKTLRAGTDPPPPRIPSTET